MHNPLDDMELDTFLERLNMPLRRMPPQERAELHVEVRQHLDSLVAAYEELGLSRNDAMQSALRAFGDPTKIGGRLYGEWRRCRAQRLPQPTFTAAVSVACGIMALEALSFSAMAAAPSGFAGGLITLAATVSAFGGAPLIAGAAAGRKFGEGAVAGTFYATLPFAVLGLLGSLPNPSTLSLFVLCWCPASAACAYLASAVKQGRLYRLSWRDARLQLRSRA